jgi:hypothetical protein
MDQADDEDDDGVFVFMGGNQRVPRDVTHVRIHKSAKIIGRYAFRECNRLLSIEMYLRYDGLEIIEEKAFYECDTLRGIKLSGVRVIEHHAFYECNALEEVEFGDELETIGVNAFYYCESIRNIKIPKVRIIEMGAFRECDELTEVELTEDLETIGEWGFTVDCPRLRRILIPLKDNLLDESVFDNCGDLSQVDLLGGYMKLSLRCYSIAGKMK